MFSLPRLLFILSPFVAVKIHYSSIVQELYSAIHCLVEVADSNATRIHLHGIKIYKLKRSVG